MGVGFFSRHEACLGQRTSLNGGKRLGKGGGWLWKGKCEGDLVAVPDGPNWKGKSKGSDLFPQAICFLVDSGTKTTTSFLLSLEHSLGRKMEETGT